ncbi:phosphatidate cytidylyltransferase [Paramaledivibacter caminithermalis]|jgi:phosphatidate cytidylyltransferase|uniref:Phosphatidate cytidylyltransferase n=1 Tax=Paramaledivibacter caminithermalis (strain DSM 15212 / CIP 107654 / DViRD3) TaxID=1121301 RepID=A0A1M6N655_PARC5|nr:phosphatidate cytidylyltransferase [Paramaledivibacter caminithermalis]SHJ91076.1 phosphatidate cytidylyltransferase [Paramaledivibacter caminithermalis DSM 15212]
MLKRILTGVIGLPLLIFIVISGGWILKLSTLVVVLMALREFYQSFNHKNIYPLSCVGYLFTVFMYTTASNFNINLTFLLITFASLIIFLFNKKVTFNDIAITLLGFLYISYFLLHIILTSKLNSNLIIWFIFIIAWSADTSAYFAGNFLGSKLFGPKKLFPEVSPKKTIEGFIGGICGSTLASFLFSYFFIPSFMVHSIIIGFFGSIISQTGDLIASRIKRAVGIKDFGNVMPGHGGILDRFDSILLIAPVVYYYALFFFK